jgi:hypothetical protein
MRVALALLGKRNAEHHGTHGKGSDMSKRIVGSSKSARVSVFVLPLLAGVASIACSTKALERAVGIDQASIECEGYASGGTVDASFDAELKAFMSASLDLEQVSGDVRVAVRQACTNIAVDLGAPNNFGEIGDDDRAITNSDGTGACDVASARINAIMEVNAQANFSLQYSRGYCRQDFEEIKKCDQECKQVETCEPGKVEERCTPGELSVQCNGSCKAHASCKGTFEFAANCQGKCEAECQGECLGTCTAADGSMTENNPNCQGKCSATCTGKCTGSCQIEASAGIECGASVRCKGGCQAQYTEPSCETHCTPPKCTVSTACWESCTSRVEAKTVCEPTRVTLYANGSVHADVQALVRTVNANLGILVDAAEVKGKIAVDACERLVSAGETVVKSTNLVDIQARSCAAVAVKKAGVAAGRMHASVSGSASVVGACSSHSK